MNEMMEMVMGFEANPRPIKHIPGPEGVRGRNSDNALIRERLGWEPTISLVDGLRITYFWIKVSEQLVGKSVGEYAIAGNMHLH